MIGPQLVVDGRAVVAVRVAGSFWARQRGLLLRPDADGALWIERCRSVHTHGMRYAIDVAFVDRAGRVVDVRRLQPWRGPTRVVTEARDAVEASAGSFAAWGLRRGSYLTVG